MEDVSRPCVELSEAFGSFTVPEEEQVASKRKRSCSPPKPPKRPKLSPIEIPSSLNTGLGPSTSLSFSSLFSATASDGLSIFDDLSTTASPSALDLAPHNDAPALRTAPPIQGLHFDSSLRIPHEVEESVMAFCMKNYFVSPMDNQVMLFGRFRPPSSSPSLDDTISGLPNILLDLLDRLSTLLKPHLPQDAYSVLFPPEPTMARQAIINLYQPGEGISSHVDLLGRYADGIIGVSFGSGCVMRFDKGQEVEAGLVHEEDNEANRWDLYLPQRSVLVLTGDARYRWTHGIEKKLKDFVSSGDATLGVVEESIGGWSDRSVRISVTFRWLLPGADVVGDVHNEDVED